MDHMRVALLFLVGCGFQGSSVDPPEHGACRITAIAAGGDHTCAARDDGKVVCWGSDAQREVGVAPAASCKDAPCVPTPAVVDIPIAVKELGLGLTHTCAGDGSAVYCWGRNDMSQFGTGGA